MDLFFKGSPMVLSIWPIIVSRSCFFPVYNFLFYKLLNWYCAGNHCVNSTIHDKHFTIAELFEIKKKKKKTNEPSNSTTFHHSITYERQQQQQTMNGSLVLVLIQVSWDKLTVRMLLQGLL